MDGKLRQLARSIDSPLQFNHGWTIQKVIRFHKQHKRGVCHIVALPFTLKKVFEEGKRKNNKNSNFPMQKYNLQKKKNPLKEIKILQDIIITL